MGSGAPVVLGRRERCNDAAVTDHYVRRLRPSRSPLRGGTVSREWRCGRRRCILMSRPGGVLTTQQRAIATRLPVNGRPAHGDDRFRHCLRDCEKRVEDAGLSRKRSLQTISANNNSTVSAKADFALAA